MVLLLNMKIVQLLPAEHGMIFNSTCVISERGVFNNNVRSTDSKYINLRLYFVLYHGIFCVTGRAPGLFIALSTQV